VSTAHRALGLGRLTEIRRAVRHAVELWPS
jgi:hypothetical protein